MKLSAYIAATLIAAGIPTLASASTANEWRVFGQTDDGRVTSVVSGSESANGAIISCAGGELLVGVGIEPGDFSQLISASESSRVRNQNATITIGGDSLKTIWAYYPGRKVAFGSDVITAKKFYNAAVKGELVTWKTAYKDEVPVSFPSMNDAFRRFANDCPVTNPDNQ